MIPSLEQPCKISEVISRDMPLKERCILMTDYLIDEMDLKMLTHGLRVRALRQDAANVVLLLSMVPPRKGWLIQVERQRKDCWALGQLRDGHHESPVIRKLVIRPSTFVWLLHLHTHIFLNKHISTASESMSL